MKNLIAFGIGLLFSAGLLVSGMYKPEKILGFLDLAGRWDPSLLFVMGGAIALAAPGFWLAERRAATLFGERIAPLPQQIDRQLIVGAAIFGAGWGLSGVCPGPAIVNLGFVSEPAIVFFAAMIAGMVFYEYGAPRFGKLAPDPV
jgi:uncharacterized membrane protein YedE/YeeE